MTQFEVAQVHVTGYGGSHDAIAVHPPIEGEDARTLQARIWKGPGILLSNGQSDCTEISFTDPSRMKPEELRVKVAQELVDAGHEVRLLSRVVRLSVLDPHPENLHELMVEAQQ